jgi:hypothetical protein
MKAQRAISREDAYDRFNAEEGFLIGPTILGSSRKMKWNKGLHQGVRINQSINPKLTLEAPQSLNHATILCRTMNQSTVRTNRSLTVGFHGSLVKH